MRSKVELLLAILELCDEEGEDLSFGDLLDFVVALDFNPQDIEELLKYRDLPPRVVIARLFQDPSWRSHLKVASAKFLEKKLREVACKAVEG